MQSAKLGPTADEIIEEETGLGASYAATTTPMVTDPGMPASNRGSLRLTLWLLAELQGNEEPGPTSVMGLLSQAKRGW